MRSRPARPIIGVNARNLQTLKVDPSIFARLAPLIPDSIVRIAESGVRGPRDVIDLARSGADVVLVGEALVTGRDPRSGVADLVAAGRTLRCTSPRPASSPRWHITLSHVTLRHSTVRNRVVQAVHGDLGAAGCVVRSLPDASGHFDRFGGQVRP